MSSVSRLHLMCAPCRVSSAPRRPYTHLHSPDRSPCARLPSLQVSPPISATSQHRYTTIPTSQFDCAVPDNICCSLCSLYCARSITRLAASLECGSTHRSVRRTLAWSRRIVHGACDLWSVFIVGSSSVARRDHKLAGPGSLFLPLVMNVHDFCCAH